MTSIFSRIVAGEIPCHKVAEDDNFLAFLDNNPLIQGHTLAIPKIEVDYIFDLEDKILSNLMVFSKKVAHGIQKAIPCERIGVSVIGLEVPHAHVHLIPINTISDMNFSNEKLNLDHTELSIIAAQIAKYI